MPLPASILARLEFQHNTTDELIEGYSEAELKVRRLPGKWSVFENIVHLFTYQQLFHRRVQLINEGSSPVIAQYVADNDPQHIKHLERSLPEVLTELNSDRKLLFDQLRSMPAQQLSCTGLHPVYGKLTLVQWSEFFLLHEAHHLFTIFKLINISPANRD